MTLISHSLGQIRDIIPPKVKEKWRRLPTNTALIGGTLIAALGIGYLGYRWTIQQNPLRLPQHTIEAVKRVAETIPIAVGSGQIVNIQGSKYLIVKKEDGLPDAFILAEKAQKFAGQGSEGVANRIYSLYTNTFSKVIKVPYESVEGIENGIQIVSKVNPDGKTRGCIKTPFPVTKINEQGRQVLRGALIEAYDSDADVAARPSGIIGALHRDANVEIYHLDILHQALSILVKLQEIGVAHYDIAEVNIFVSRDADGFITFHLGDWDHAVDEADDEQIKYDHVSMAQALYGALYRSSPNNKRLGIILEFQNGESMPQELLTALNQELISRATHEPASLWHKAAQRAGLIPSHI
jgi:hypothetical protein